MISVIDLLIIERERMKEALPKNIRIYEYFKYGILHFNELHDSPSLLELIGDDQPRKLPA